MAKITVVAKPNEIKTSESSDIMATVNDDSGALAKNQEVTFIVDDGTKGKVMPEKTNTDGNGIAKTTLKPEPTAKSVTITVTAKAMGAEDGKEIKIIGALDEMLAELKKSKEELQKKKAETGQLEGKVQTLQDAIQVLGRVTLPPPEIAKRVEDYGKRHKQFEANASDMNIRLQRIEDSVKADPKIADQLKAIEDKRAKVDKEIAEKKDKRERLKKELDQFNEAVANAENEFDQQKNSYEVAMETETTVDNNLKDFKRMLDDLEKNYQNKTDKTQVIYFTILDLRNGLKEKVNDILLKPDALKKKLEDQWKALETAQQKLKQAELNAAEKKAELDVADNDHQEAERNREKSIKEFINNIVGA